MGRQTQALVQCSTHLPLMVFPLLSMQLLGLGFQHLETTPYSSYTQASGLCQALKGLQHVGYPGVYWAI